MSQSAAAALIAAVLIVVGGGARLKLGSGGRADLKGLAVGLVWAGVMFGVLSLVFVWANHMD